MQEFLDKVKTNKTMLYFLVVSIIVLLCIALNYTFSAFTASREQNAANITIGSLSYDTEINGSSGSIITATSNTITKTNITLISNNNFDTNYELTYEICTTSNCSSTVNSVSGLKVEYSSRTQDDVSGTVTSSENKEIRLIVTNPTNTIYYIRIGINAGFSHNALLKTNQINKEYSEDDLTIYTYIDNEESDSFPDDSNYTATVSCHDPLGNSVNATGTATWDSTNSKWVLAVANLDTGETRCDVRFTTKTVKTCTYNGTLTQGAEFVDGQYTYRYMQIRSACSASLTWDNQSNMGWGVSLTDINSSNEVATELCDTINDQPVNNFTYAFYKSSASRIDLSSIDTSDKNVSLIGVCSTITRVDAKSDDDAVNLRPEFTTNTAIYVDNVYKFNGSRGLDTCNEVEAACGGSSGGKIDID